MLTILTLSLVMIVLVAISLGGIVVGASLYAGALHVWMERRYGHRDYRPDLQQTARVLSILRWTCLAVVVLVLWSLYAAGKWDAAGRWDIALYVFAGWVIVSLLARITGRTLRTWGTEA
jgi:hypothetical protein